MWCLKAARFILKTSTLLLHEDRVFGCYIFDHSTIGALSSWNFDQIFCRPFHGIVQIECTVSTSWRRGQIVRRHAFFLSFRDSIGRDSFGLQMKKKKKTEIYVFRWIEMKRFKEVKIRWLKKLATAAVRSEKVHLVSVHAVNARIHQINFTMMATNNNNHKKKADEWYALEH